ncbi:DeoR/GlpR family DNA-binding transcription regulator [Bacillus sp. T33-2]|uniref:DeoR/GlpR family DNA-binding transcription regulator n=1 Tax=Bacillus sp. T33-2 TaxID=2054168 RepID=UPI000C77282E|nr:DeoR/GlpR family DNA-binding transcription regulator [Bacillus sp. T33-2]PLR98821.1 DeoR family transcriptional regulator [Bacillus sp. T33-2]
MLTPERHRLILQAIKEKPIVKVQELVDLTESSESTIRRDLTQLEEEKFLKRVHGGAARLQGKLQEPSMSEKSAKNLQEKREIAQYAASLVEEGDCIYLDAGSTVTEMIPFLTEKDIVVVTNGLMHISGLLERRIKTFIIGGFAKETTNAIIGRGALTSLDDYRFDKCFMGVNGIHPEYGYTTPDQEEAVIKEKAISLSREAFVLADETKFFEIAFAKITELHHARIITNKLDPETELCYSRKTTIKVVAP